MPPSESHPAPLRIFLVEDEAMIAVHMEDMVADLGHEVAATAMKLAEAVELARECDVDFAILDVNLAGEMSFPVADALAQRGVPYVFVTGYGSASILPPYNQQRIVHKPVGLNSLRRALGEVAP